ncbi:MAG: ROK family protein [Peptococcaceae bacterium]
MEEKIILGLDIGGTSIKSGLVNERGLLKDFQSIPTNSRQGPDHVLDTIKNLIKSYQEQNALQGIGIALAGSIERTTGNCLYSPNLHWNNINFGKIIEQSAGLEVRLINDANAACLGEFFHGAGKSYHNILCITLGTGIGSAVILDKKLFTGTSGFAPEAGHMILKKDGPLCSCGNKGCWETLVSASAIIKKISAKIQSGEYPINQFTKGSNDSFTLQDIFKAWQEGEPQAVEIITEVKEYLALGLANLINIFNPQCLILGGGIIELNDALLIGLDDMVKKLTFPTFKNQIIIKKAKLGNKAGLIGGASLFFKEIETLGG